MHKLIYLMTATLLLNVSLGCTIPNQVSTTDKIKDPFNSVDATHNSKINRLLTKTATIFVEGEKVPITLKLYDQYSDLFTTYFPEKDFIAEGNSSGEGTGVRFIANFGGSKNEKAYVHIAFLNNFRTLGNVRSFINGKRGLIASNKWRVVSKTQTVAYPWAKEKIVFSNGKDITGNLYLSQQKGKAFYIIIHYPVEYGDGFPPRADLILRNIQIES